MLMVFTDLLIPQTLFFAQINCPTDRNSRQEHHCNTVNSFTKASVSGAVRKLQIHSLNFPSSGTELNLFKQSLALQTISYQRQKSEISVSCLTLAHMHLTSGALYHLYLSCKLFPKHNRIFLNPLSYVSQILPAATKAGVSSSAKPEPAELLQCMELENHLFSQNPDSSDHYF